MIKINFRQPKYIFPLVVFVPLCAMVYFLMQTFGGDGETAEAVATDHINMELPEAQTQETGDKMYEMSRRFDDEDAFTAVGALGEEEKENENWVTATPRTSLTALTPPKPSASAGSRKWRNWSVHWPNQESTSTPTLTATVLPVVVQKTVTPRRMTLPVTLKRYRNGAMNGRRPLKPDSVTASRKRRKLRKTACGLHRQGTQGGSGTQPPEPCPEILRHQCRQVPYRHGLQ